MDLFDVSAVFVRSERSGIDSGVKDAQQLVDVEAPFFGWSVLGCSQSDEVDQEKVMHLDTRRFRKKIIRKEINDALSKQYYESHRPRQFFLLFSLVEEKKPR